MSRCSLLCLNNPCWDAGECRRRPLALPPPISCPKHASTRALGAVGPCLVYPCQMSRLSIGAGWLEMKAATLPHWVTQSLPDTAVCRPPCLRGELPASPAVWLHTQARVISAPRSRDGQKPGDKSLQTAWGQIWLWGQVCVQKEWVVAPSQGTGTTVGSFRMKQDLLRKPLASNSPAGGRSRTGSAEP